MDEIIHESASTYKPAVFLFLCTSNFNPFGNVKALWIKVAFDKPDVPFDLCEHGSYSVYQVQLHIPCYTTACH